MPHIRVGNENLFYAVNRSEPSRLDVVLIHGAGGSHLVWPAELRRLAGATVYALDLPAHGKSDGRPRDSIGEYAAVLIGWLDALHIERAVLVGHSMGGAIAQQIALDYPQRAGALVLIATGARLRVAPNFLEGLRTDYARTLDAINSYAWGPQTSEAAIRQGRQHLAQADPQTTHDDFAACNMFDIVDRLGQINAPTLVIGGAADQLTPARYAIKLAEGIAGAQLRLIENAGHMVMLEWPEQVARAVSDFLDTLTI